MPASVLQRAIAADSSSGDPARSVAKQPMPQVAYSPWAERVLPYRARIRNALESMTSEFLVTSVVLVYMLLVLVDLVIADASPVDAQYCNETLTYQNQTFDCEENNGIEVWETWFLYTDLAILTLFTLELTVRLYAFGFMYLLDWVNFLDACIVVGSLALQLAAVSGMIDGSFAFFRILRMVRLLRLFMAMNKVQKTRTHYKKTMYLKLGSPVERVMDLLTDIKERISSEDDKADVAWIMHLISSDKLYSIDIRSAGGANLSTEMTEWLVGNMGMKKDVEAEHDITDLVPQSELPEFLSQQSSLIEKDASPELKLLAELSDMPELAPHFQKLHDWDFDIFEFVQKACVSGRHNGLVLGLFTLLDHYDLIDKYNLSRKRLATFTRKIQEGYRADNPYHNSTHALDVTLNMNYFMRHDAIDQLITPLDRLAALVAATIHDFQHPGLNNNFLSATKHEYAITYNDQSILESHHVASAWKVLMMDECNFIKRLSKEQYIEMRDTVIQLVLGTDMKFHFEHYTKFKTKVSSDTFIEGCERHDVKFLLSVALHTADIANPAKPLNICVQWTHLVMEEFFRQGDLEAKLGMPISPFYDRTKTSVAQCQMGFINVLVKPLYAEFTGLLGAPASQDCLAALEENLQNWEAQGDALLKVVDTTALRGSHLATA